MKKIFKILLIGGSGSLGSNIIKINKSYKIDYPSSKKLNLKNFNSIKKFINKKYDLVIHAAGLARVRECENNPRKAIETNVVGTFNLVQALKMHQLNNENKVKIIYISSDAVYQSTTGSYREDSPRKPYNVYGWTKYLSELIVEELSNFVIIRTRFFNDSEFKYDEAADNIFSSMISVKYLAKIILNIIKKDFRGIINIGGKRKSDYSIYKKFKKNLRICKREELIKKLDYSIAKDSSMNINKFNKLFFK